MRIVQRVLQCFMIAVWAIIVPFWGYIGYMEFIYTPPPPFECYQGMTLQPRQTCYLRVPDGIH